jgi:hypothetical protein
MLTLLKDDDVSVSGAVKHCLQVWFVGRDNDPLRRSRQSETGGNYRRRPRPQDSAETTHHI